MPPACVPKTLVARVDGTPVRLLVASDRAVAMKRVAAALGGKAAAMPRPADAERISGRHVDGISPLGQRKRVPAPSDAGSLGDGEVHVNGGGRGLQVRLRPADPSPCWTRRSWRRPER